MHTACPMLQEMPLKRPHSFNSLGGGDGWECTILEPADSHGFVFPETRVGYNVRHGFGFGNVFRNVWEGIWWGRQYCST